MKIENTKRPKKLPAYVCAAAAALALLLSLTVLAVRGSPDDEGSILQTNNTDWHDVTDWRQGQTKPMNIYASNPSGSESPVYVRISIKEYMDMYSPRYIYEMDTETYEPYRFLTYGPDTDKAGQFYAFGSRQDAEAWASSNGFAGRVYPANITTGPINQLIPGDTEHYYILTAPGDINGQYGKYLVTGMDYQRPIILGEVGELLPHDEIGDYTAFFDLYDPSSAIREYVAVNFGSNVVSLTDWISNGSPAGGCWVYDDQTTETPYFYWSEAIAPGDQTADLIESLTLIKQPEEAFFYAIDAAMQVVDYAQIDAMAEISSIPQAILSAWRIAQP